MDETLGVEYTSINTKQNATRVRNMLTMTFAAINQRLYNTAIRRH